MTFKDRYQRYLTHIEGFLNDQWFCDSDAPQKTLSESMRYSLLAGGKRLRPVFVFDFCRMCGGDWKKATQFAAAVEMIHTYSLIHDDLPCMDNDDFRRGKPTNHKVYGEALAVLAGDALLTEAFCYLSLAPQSAESKSLAVMTLAQCAGVTGMVGGQLLDIQSEQRQCTEQEVLDIQSRKTGALIKAACMLGVYAGGGSMEQIAAAGMFAEHLGLAFQIRDDMLDVIGNAEELGKATGMDGNKNTFVRLYGLEKCEKLIQEHTNAAIEALKVFEETAFMISLSRQLTNRTA